MRKLDCFTYFTFTLFLSSAMCALGQERQLELINPDGSVATDCLAIPVIAPSVHLNDQLQLQMTNASVEHPNQSAGDISPWAVPLNVGKSGLLNVPAEAKVVVAQNEHGFAFVPPNALSGKAKLRPWAKLKIDASAFPEKLRSKYQLRILWQNSFAGQLPDEVLTLNRPTEDPFGGPGNDDPFGDRAAAPLDWRFHDYVTRIQVVDVVDQIATVPPGEVTILLDLLVSESAVSTSIPLGIVRTASNQTAEFSLPEFGSVHGQLLDDASLPNWSEARNQPTRVFAMPGRADGILPPLAQGQLLPSFPRSQGFGDDPFAAVGVTDRQWLADAYARYCASADGTVFRSRLVRMAEAPVDEHGEFTFDVLPIGPYELLISLSAGPSDSSPQYRAAQQLSTAGGGTRATLGFVVKANELLELGSVARRAKQSEEKAVKFNAGEVSTPTPSPSVEPGTPANPNEFATASQARIETALNRLVQDIEYHSLPLAMVIDSLSDDMNIPIVINLYEFELGGFSMDAPITLSLPPVTLRSLLNLVLDQVAGGELTFVVRDEVLLITTTEDAAKHPSITYSEAQTTRGSAGSATSPPVRDRAAEIVESWLKTAPENADRSELKQLLETHLSAEFDSQQQTRRAEIDRLQQLLEQSRNWLDGRQRQREQIIQRHVQELLDEQPATSVLSK